MSGFVQSMIVGFVVSVMVTLPIAFVTLRR